MVWEGDRLHLVFLPVRGGLLWGHCYYQFLPSRIFVVDQHFLCEKAVTLNGLDCHTWIPIPAGRLSHSHRLMGAGFDLLDYCNLECLLESIKEEGHVVVPEGRRFRPDVMEVICWVLLSHRWVSWRHGDF